MAQWGEIFRPDWLSPVSASPSPFQWLMEKEKEKKEKKEEEEENLDSPKSKTLKTPRGPRALFVSYMFHTFLARFIPQHGPLGFG